MFNCSYCGGELDTGLKCINLNCITHQPGITTIKSILSNNTPIGWICPKCGIGVSPNEKVCHCNIIQS